MKESRFIELLNLYVDQQISPAEAAELETEVMRQPARRRLYRQYCQMQKACVLLGDRALNEAPASFALEAALQARGEGTADVIDFPAQRSRRWIPLAAAGAMAACVAFVVVLQTQQVAPSDNMVTAAAGERTQPVSPAPAVMVASVVEPEPVAASVLQADSRRYTSGAFISRNLALVAESEDGQNATTAVADAPSLDWIAGIKLAPIQQAALVENLQFETRPALRQDARSFQPSRTMTPLTSDSTEFVAFKFQR